MSINRDLRIALTLAALVSTCLGRACADCIDYSSATHWAGSWTVPAEIHALARIIHEPVSTRGLSAG